MIIIASNIPTIKNYVDGIPLSSESGREIIMRTTIVIIVAIIPEGQSTTSIAS